MPTGTPTTAPRHLLRIEGLSPAELQHLLDLSERMRREPTAWDSSLHGLSAACYFEKPSTRTRVSLEAAAHRLGMLPIMLRPEELQLGRGEPIEDTARVLSGYCAAIVARVFRQDVLERMAAVATVPVVNALSDDHHPCQALADVLTLSDHFGRLEGLRVAYLGDLNNVARSLADVGALAGMEVVIAAPPAYRGAGAAIAAPVVADPLEAVAGADAVYTDVWVSMGKDAERAERVHDLAPFQVTQAMMAHAAPHAVFMHCLPAHRGEEVAAEVIDGARSLVWAQAANRLPTEQAVLHALITGAFRGM